MLHPPPPTLQLSQSRVRPRSLAPSPSPAGGLIMQPAVLTADPSIWHSIRRRSRENWGLYDPTLPPLFAAQMLEAPKASYGKIW